MRRTIPSNWPNRETSRFVDSRPHRWHVQVMGEGPVMLLLHGTGASVHSWRDLMPDLAQDFRVVAVDLPGHGFTRLGSRRRSSLPAMAQDIANLCKTMELSPVAIVGHSAGAAIALEIARHQSSPVSVIGLNAALGAFEGPAAWTFPFLAKALAAAPFVPRVVSSFAKSESAVRRLLDATGSQIDAEGVAQYRALVSLPEHVDGVLEMMAQWSTEDLRRALPSYTGCVSLLYGEKDGTVPASTSETAAHRIPKGSARSLGQLGHLAHEEASGTVAEAIRCSLC